jgi:hypothetical protein
VPVYRPHLTNLSTHQITKIPNLPNLTTQPGDKPFD